MSSLTESDGNSSEEEFLEVLFNEELSVPLDQQPVVVEEEETPERPAGMRSRSELYLLSLIFFAVWSSVFHVYYAVRPPTLLKQKAVGPQRFFSPFSDVEDLFDGNRADVTTLLQQKEVIFGMYYAPWCAECLEVRWEFEKLAKFLKTSNPQVKVVAINCWDPGGHCKKSFKMYSYPVFMVYPGTAQGVYYTGPIAADYMLQFIERIVKPISVLHSPMEVERFLSLHALSAVAKFDFNSSKIDAFGYPNYHMASMKILENDELAANVGFGVVLKSSLGAAYNLSENKAVKAYRSETGKWLDFPLNTQFTSKKIIEWLDESLPGAVTWVTPSLSKSSLLDDLSEKGPLSILLTPRMPLLKSSPAFEIYKDVAESYAKCSSKSVCQRTAVDFVEPTTTSASNCRNNYAGRGSAKLQIQSWKKSCERLRKRSEEYSSRYLLQCCADAQTVSVTIAQSAYANRTFCDSCLSQPGICGKLPDSHACNSLSSVLTAKRVAQLCCSATLTDTVDSPVTQLDCDAHRSGLFEGQSELIRIRNDQSLCERYKLAKNQRYDLHWTLAECDRLEWTDSTSELMEKFTGFSCGLNRTLAFVAIDTMRFPHVAEKIGISPNDETTVISRNWTTVVILDRKEESQYVMQENFTADSFIRFITNFTEGKLRRNLRSDPIVDSSTTKPIESRLILEKVTSATFNRVVLDEDYHVILFYQSPWCGHCKATFPMYLTLAYYFRDVSGIKFTYIDSSTNDLPWQYTVDRIPSIILYPAMRKADSVPFPKHLPLTVPNLISFVLAYTDPATRLRLALQFCDPRCIRRNQLMAIQRLSVIRREIHFIRGSIAWASSRLREVESRMYSSGQFNEEDMLDPSMLTSYLEQNYKEISRRIVQRRAIRTFLKWIGDRRRTPQLDLADIQPLLNFFQS